MHSLRKEPSESGAASFSVFVITLLVAQYVNFPMQRNITFKSHGNAWFQIAWYVVVFRAHHQRLRFPDELVWAAAQAILPVHRVYDILIAVVVVGVHSPLRRFRVSRRGSVSMYPALREHEGTAPPIAEFGLLRFSSR